MESDSTIRDACDEMATFAVDTSAEALTALLSAVAQVVDTESVPELAAVANVAALTALLSATAIATAAEDAAELAVTALTEARDAIEEATDAAVPALTALDAAELARTPALTPLESAVAVAADAPEAAELAADDAVEAGTVPVETAADAVDNAVLVALLRIEPILLLLAELWYAETSARRYHYSGPATCTALAYVCTTRSERPTVLRCAIGWAQTHGPMPCGRVPE